MWPYYRFVFLAYVTLNVIENCNALKCFECSDVPFPRDCGRVRTCGTHEYCHVEQYVTPDGSVKYNSGCLDKQRCQVTSSSLVGRRSNFNITEKRSTDLTTCLQCCNSEFCNNKGCGTTDVSRSTRGPYCFTCYSASDPTMCNQVSVCPLHDICVLLSPLDLNGLPETLYRGQCQSKVSCDVVATTNRNTICPVHCCDQDFCNDRCGSFSNITMTTPKAVVTPSTPKLTSTTVTVPVPTKVSVSTTPGHATVPTCKIDHHYDDITGMCIRLFESQTVTFDEAKRRCGLIGDRLIEPNSIEKTVFVENTIIHSSSTMQVERRNYWIGGYDKHNNSEFFWLSGPEISYVNWGGGDEVAPNQQPDDIKTKNEDCLLLYGADRYKWSDDHCWSKWYFICEDPITLKPAAHLSNGKPCKDGHYYDDMTGMCIYIEEIRKENYKGALHACGHIGDTLVTIDSHEKTIFIENVLLHHSTVSSISDRTYYIGLTDVDNHDHYGWQNNHPMSYTNWGGVDELYSFKQPDGNHDDCVALYGVDHYKWHDVHCTRLSYYICEDTSSLKRT